MAVRSRDFVGIAEGIKSHELSTKGKIERLKSRVSELSVQKSSLDSTISYLEATLAAAYEMDDPDYGLISLLEEGKRSAENELSLVEQELDVTGTELKQSESELESVLEKKAQTLFEIQERARKTSKNITIAGGMYGAYSGVGSSLQESMKVSLSSLSRAARIIDGSVDANVASSSGNAISGSGSSASPERGISQGEMSTSSLAAFAGGSTHKSQDNSSYLSSSRFASGQLDISTPATRSNFCSGRTTINTQKPVAYESPQESNNYTLYTFSAVSQNAPILPGLEEYLTAQESQLISGFSSREMGHNENDAKETHNKKDIGSHNYQSEQRSKDVSAFIPPSTSKPMYARHGRNPFLDSLIVQDWELGRYSDASLSYERKKAARKDYYDYLNNPNEYKHVSFDGDQPILYVDPATIQEIKGIYDANFWSYKKTSYSDYIDMARQIPIVYSKLKSGQKLTDLAERKDIIGACARNYFLNNDITVIRVGNGYIFGGEGRHRVMAALIAGVNIPVRVTDELLKNQSQTKGDKKSSEFSNESMTISDQIKKADKNELINIVKNEQLAKRVDFGKMDVRVARELVETVKNAKVKFPFLELPFIGATQSLNDNLHRNIEANLTRLYIQNNPTVPIEKIMNIVKSKTDEYMKDFRINKNDLAVSITVEQPKKIERPKPGKEREGVVTTYVGDTFASKLSGISINADNATDYSSLCHKLSLEEQNGHSPKGCNSVSYLINHEIGHQLDNVLQLSNDPDIFVEFIKHIRLSRTEQVANLCDYASTNVREFIAEAWAESQCSKSPRRVARMIEEKVRIASKKYIDARKGDGTYVREREL